MNQLYFMWDFILQLTRWTCSHDSGGIQESRRECMRPLLLWLFSHSVVSDSFRHPWTAARQTSLSISNNWSLLKLKSIESVMPSNHLILCRSFLLLPSVFPSILIFSNESALHIRWPKYWSFSISPSNEYSELISFRIDWFDLLVGQGTPKSLRQHHSLKAPVLQCSAFFMAWLSHPYMTIELNQSFDYMEFCQQIMPLPFNALSRFVILFFKE